jgi:hypothetical protein
MAIHHTRLKKAMTLIGEEKEVPKIIQLLSQADYKDEEIQEILQGAAFATNGPAKIDEAQISKLAEADNAPVTVNLADPAVLETGTVVGYGDKPVAAKSKYADFDVLMGKAITKQYRHISGETRSYISHFQLSEKVKTVRIEPALAKDFNRFAIGFIDNPGLMYFPAGTKQVGDIQTYQDPTYKPMNETTVTNEFMD